jgi:hypothetical protein
MYLWPYVHDTSSTYGATDDHPRPVLRQRPARRAPAHQRLPALEQYPQITFVSTDIRQVDEITFEVSGDLTSKDVTKSITVPFEFEGASQDPFATQRIGFDGSVTISRKDYGITWNAALETGGVLVSDKIALEFEVSSSRPCPEDST